MAKKDFQTIQSLDRGLTLLDLLAEKGDGLAQRELAEELGLDPSNVSRMLATLARHGLVNQDVQSRRFSLGFGLYRLCGAMNRRLLLPQVCRPELAHLARTTGENSHLAVLTRGQAVFIDLYAGGEMVAVQTEVGQAEPLYCTAVGKALLAFQEPARRAELLRAMTLRRLTRRTITRKADLAKELDRIAEERVAVDREEFTDGVVCVASPIVNYDGRTLAVIGVSGPAERVYRSLEEIVRAVKGAAARLSARFGHAAMKEKK
ncbi:MAG: IclR family transcriptional regulator [Candidatus Sumerlaeota bacterium]|nr:IclR family transcriptional regulator [Candidatus Sumerlaeota bacterium]